MSKVPLVSVLMTVYNREKYLPEAIESVLASSFTDFELIVVDDCSKDHSVSIVRKYEEKDSRIKLYVNEKNLGDYPNRNRAASLARGKYLKYLDSDDTIYPHGLEVMVEAMEKFPEAALGMQCNIREHKFPYPFLVSSQEAFQEHFLKNGFFFSGPTGTIIKKEIFDLLGGFSGRRFVGDTEMWLKLTAKHPVVLFQPSLIWWRQHEGQEFQLGHLSEAYIKMNNLLIESALSDKSCPLKKEERKKALKLYKKREARNAIRRLARVDVKGFFVYYNNSKQSLFTLLKSLIPNKL